MFALLMLISHTISDFLIQTNETVSLKSELRLKGYIKHGATLLISSLCMIVLVQVKDLPTIIVRIIVIVGIHLLIDYLKELLQRLILSNKSYSKSRKGIFKLILFPFDQIIYIFVVLILTKNVITLTDIKSVFVIIYIALSGAYLIPLIFDVVYANVEGYTEKLDNQLKEDIEDQSYHVFIEEVKIGKWIGILERILILIFLYSNQLASIGFIIAVKSLARFKMMDSKIFSEYFLLGIPFSVVYTFSGFIILQRIL